MPNPVAFSIGPPAVHWYGIMYVLAFTMFIVLVRVRIKQAPIAAQGQKGEDLDGMLLYGTLGVVVGGRLGQVLFYQAGYFLANPIEILKTRKGGMSFHGGFIGVLIAMGV